MVRSHRGCPNELANFQRFRTERRWHISKGEGWCEPDHLTSYLGVCLRGRKHDEYVSLHFDGTKNPICKRHEVSMSLIWEYLCISLKRLSEDVKAHSYNIAKSLEQPQSCTLVVHQLSPPNEFSVYQKSLGTKAFRRSRMLGWMPDCDHQRDKRVYFKFGS